ncbi:MAG: DUF547 domain-containing protein [Lewinellaceae bacterium]|nr:DUF547 domain-containing protein [Saprospiraceae bacterium]MCB9354721.1 DUF547 domain-containing protein [Lewinellaceae bacterium]
MKKTILIVSGLLVVALIWFTCSYCRAIRRDTDSRPVTHERWNALLKKHVDAKGFVDYKGFIRDSSALNDYLKVLESAHPNEQYWTRNEQMAYWINAYNAYTIQLIVRHYPVASIKDIKKGLAFVNSVWDIKFIHIQGYTYDLNNIEHNILRAVFKDARIHAAINCASYSCPRLLDTAYTAGDLERQLDAAMEGFINDPLRNRIGPEKAEISEIFKWFKGDFERDAGSLRAYLNRYAGNKVDENTKIEYIDYDWRLNERGE